MATQDMKVYFAETWEEKKKEGESHINRMHQATAARQLPSWPQRQRHRQIWQTAVGTKGCMFAVAQSPWKRLGASPNTKGAWEGHLACVSASKDLSFRNWCYLYLSVTTQSQIYWNEYISWKGVFILQFSIHTIYTIFIRILDISSFLICQESQQRK